MKALLEIFYQPGKLFENLPQRRGAWVAPSIVDVLLVALTSFLTIRLAGLETIVRQRLEDTRLSPEQMQRALDRAVSQGPITTYAGSLVGVVLILVIVAGLLKIFAMIASREPRFGTMLSMVSIAYFPYFLIVGIMSVLILLAAPDRTALNYSNLIATNPAAYLDKASMSKGLYSLLTSMDLLSFGEIGLLAYGFAKVNKTGISFGLVSVLSLWVLYVVFRMALTMIF